MPIQSMESLYNLARAKQQLKQNEYDPYAGVANSVIGSLSGIVEYNQKQKLEDEQRERDRPMEEAELFYKMLQAERLQGEIDAENKRQARNQEIHQQLFGNLDTGKQRAAKDANGKPINTTAGLMDQVLKGYDTSYYYDSGTGNYKIESKPKKAAKTSLITGKKELTDFEKGERLVKQAETMVYHYSGKGFTVPPEVQRRADAMVKQGNKLMGIDYEKMPAPTQQQEPEGKISRFFNSMFGRRKTDGDRFTVGETRQVKGKTWKYIGNDQWQEVE